jgi:hypothetical protein
MSRMKASLDEKLALSPTGAELVFTEYAKDADGSWVPPGGWGTKWCAKCSFKGYRYDFPGCRGEKCRSSMRLDKLMGYWKRKS